MLIAQLCSKLRGRGANDTPPGITAVGDTGAVGTGIRAAEGVETTGNVLDERVLATGVGIDLTVVEGYDTAET